MFLYDMVVYVLTLWWWVVPLVVSCAGVMNASEAGKYYGHYNSIKYEEFCIIWHGDYTETKVVTTRCSIYGLSEITKAALKQHVVVFSITI
jgi:hypothetical protein